MGQTFGNQISEVRSAQIRANIISNYSDCLSGWSSYSSMENARHSMSHNHLYIFLVLQIEEEKKKWKNNALQFELSFCFVLATLKNFIFVSSAFLKHGDTFVNARNDVAENISTTINIS